MQQNKNIFLKFKNELVLVGKIGMILFFISIIALISGSQLFVSAYTADEFVTVWKTDNAGTSNSTSITIPTNGAGYNYDVDWTCDGTFDDIGATGDITHDYGTAGTYDVCIRGQFPEIYFNNDGDRQKILEVKQWGNIQWRSMQNAFFGASNLDVTATDTPDLSSVTNVEAMFSGNSSLVGNSSFNNWNTSNVTRMWSMFLDATSFNQDIGSWDTSKVITMSRMFKGATLFNQNIGSWNTSNVTNFGGMFNDAKAFNNGQPAGASTAPLNWDTSKATGMWSMFFGAAAFNQPIGSWNTSAVTNMSGLFGKATNFNQPIGNWNTSKVVDMNGMFNSATKFNQPIGSWDTSNVTNMQGIFQRATKFNNGEAAGASTAPLDWNTSKVTNMLLMFFQAAAFNQPINNWNTSNVTGMTSMFYGASKFNQPIGGWDTSKVTNMSSMFNSAAVFDQDISNWNTSNVTNMSQMFSNASLFNNGSGERLNWNTSKVTVMNNMFYNTIFNKPLNHWDTGRVTNFSFMFGGNKVFNQSIGAWDVSKATNFSAMFIGALAFNQPLNTWQTTSLTSMANMFNGASSFNSSVAGWDTSKVTDMSSVFVRAQSFNQPLDSWDVSNVTTMSSMFSSAYIFNQPLNNWDVGNLVTASLMFWQAHSFNQPLNNWDVRKLATADSMLRNTAFNQDLSSWQVLSLTDASDILTTSQIQPDNYDKLLNSWSQQLVKPNVTFGAQDRYYCNAEPARDILTSTPNNWIITDSGQGCPPSNLELSNTNVPENSTSVGTVSAITENLPQSFILVPGIGSEDNNKFILDQTTGVLTFLTAPDFENPQDLGDTPNNNTYSIRVQAKDRLSRTTEKVFIITVLDVDDVAPEVAITPTTKFSATPITDTVIEVSDRFSIASIQVDDVSTLSADNLICAPVPGSTTSSTNFPYINDAPSPNNHLTIRCSIRINSSGSLVIKGTDSSGYSSTATEIGYVIDSTGPDFSVARVDTETHGINQPIVYFNATDPSGIDRYEITYRKDNNGAGIDPNLTTDTLTNAGSYTINLDPDEAQHTVSIKAYDSLYNSTVRSIIFPPTIIFNTPTLISNQPINDVTLTITSPVSGHQIDNIVVSGSASTGVTLGTCIDINNNTTAPYDTTVICELRNIQNTGLITIDAQDITTGAVGNSSQQFFFDTEQPAITIIAPTTFSAENITDTTITITDNVSILPSGISIDSSSTATVEGLSCVADPTDEDRINCTINITESGRLIIRAIDLAGNTNTASQDYTIDRIPPALTMNEPTNIPRYKVGDYKLTGECTYEDGEILITINSQPYTTTCTSEGEWQITLDLAHIPDGNVEIIAQQTDAVNNSTQVSATVIKDTIIPVVTLNPLITNQGSPELTGTVDDPTASIVVELMNSNQYDSYVATNNQDGTWTLDAGVITHPLEDGVYQTVVIATDPVMNSDKAFDPNGLIVNTGRPNVTVNQAEGQPDPTNVGSIQFTILFSKNIKEETFTAEDLEVVGSTGVVTNLTRIDARTYTATVEGMTSEDIVTLTLPENRVEDIAGNPNTASTSEDNSVTYSTTRPIPTIKLGSGQTPFTNSSPIKFEIHLSKPALLLPSTSVADIVITGSETAEITGLNVLPGYNSYFSIEVSGMLDGEEITIGVGENIVVDSAGNLSLPSTSSPTVLFDTTRPIVTINQAEDQADPTNIDSAKFTMLVSEPIAITDLIPEIFTVTGTTGRISSITEISSTEYIIEIAGMTNNDVAQLSLEKNKLKDLAGNENEASVSVDNTVTYIALEDENGMPGEEAEPEQKPEKEITPEPTLESESVNPETTEKGAVEDSAICKKKKPGRVKINKIKLIDDKALVTFKKARGRVDSYQIKYGTTGDANDKKVKRIHKERRDYTLSNLKADTTYYVEVRAINECAKGSWSKTKKVKTNSLDYGVRKFTSTEIGKNIAETLAGPTSLITAESEDFYASLDQSSQGDCSYTIQSGDTLSKIAKNKLGKTNRFPEIVELNKEAYPFLEQRLKVGDRIALPCETDSKKEQEEQFKSDSLITEEVLEKVRIKVIDKKERPLKNIKVTLYSEAQEVLTNEEGIALFPNVIPGEHRIVLQGSKKQEETIINLTKNEQVDEDYDYVITFQESDRRLFWIGLISMTSVLILGYLLMKKRDD